MPPPLLQSNTDNYNNVPVKCWYFILFYLFRFFIIPLGFFIQLRVLLYSRGVCLLKQTHFIFYFVSACLFEGRIKMSQKIFVISLCGYILWFCTYPGSRLSYNIKIHQKRWAEIGKCCNALYSNSRLQLSFYSTSEQSSETSPLMLWMQCVRLFNYRLMAHTTYCQAFFFFFVFKGIIHLKMKILSSFTHLFFI